MMTVLFVVCDDDSVITITVDCNHTTYDGRFYHLFLFLCVLIGRLVDRGWSGMCVIARCVILLRFMSFTWKIAASVCDTNILNPFSKSICNGYYFRSMRSLSSSSFHHNHIL